MNSSSQNRPVTRTSKTLLSHQTTGLPLADGHPAPSVKSPDRQDAIRLEFLAAYRELNRAYARLLESRENSRRPGSRRAEAERAALQHVESALRRRDALEDQYAALGVVAEPIIRDGFTVDVCFSFGGLRARPSLYDREFSSSAYVSIPLPLQAQSTFPPTARKPLGQPPSGRKKPVRSKSGGHTS